MRLIVTRPAREAREWVQALGDAGMPALALPLIDILPAPEVAPVQQAWRSLGHDSAVMFVSANAVAGFFALKPEDVPGFQAGTQAPRAWATGPGTRQALLQAGVPAECIDAPPPDAPQFDSEALWQRVATQISSPARVLIVRGADAQAGGSTQGLGRDWLAQRIRAAGGTVDFVASYRRGPPQLDEAQLQLAQAAAQDGSVWLFSSSEALHNLQTLLPQQDWRAARVVATHARIAAAAREMGFGQVRESRPALADVMASVESTG